jgi:molecular chaperone GrpE
MWNMHNDKLEQNSETLNLEHELPPAGGTDEVSGPSPGAHNAETSSSSSDLEQVRQERDALLDRLARLQAEFENARKRAEREQLEFKQFALADALTSLLPILDGLERAIETPVKSLEELRSGVELVRKQFVTALNRLGVTQVQAKGSPFDPQVHQAVEMVETTSASDGQVLEELQRGYKLNGRLLRPAMVRLARTRRSDTEQAA